jgi:hypothetical protein
LDERVRDEPEGVLFFSWRENEKRKRKKNGFIFLNLMGYNFGYGR